MKLKGIAVLVGTVGSLISGASAFGELRDAGETPGDALTTVLTGYRPGGTNDGKTVVKRLTRTYGPVAGGVAVHKGASYFGVNRALPKGVNL